MESISKWKDIIVLLSEYIQVHNATVSRKIDIAIKHLITAVSIEQYQQIGITMRDAWIEFSQSIFRQEFLPVGINNVSPSDAKRLTEYSLRQANGNNEYLIKMTKNSFDLCNKLEHDLNATQAMALQCITTSATLIGLIYKTMSFDDLITGRPYYKCPMCGSIKLEIRKEWIPDFESSFKVDVLVCTECDWHYIEELGGMSGIR